MNNLKLTTNFNKNILDKLITKFIVEKTSVKSDFRIIRADYRNSICKKCCMEKSIKKCSSKNCANLIKINESSINSNAINLSSPSETLDINNCLNSYVEVELKQYKIKLENETDLTEEDLEFKLNLFKKELLNSKEVKEIQNYNSFDINKLNSKINLLPNFSNDYLLETETIKINTNIYLKDDFYKPSSLVILNYISLYFLDLSVDGKIKDISFKKIAKFLKCNISSVRKNFIILKELGLVDYERTYLDTYNIEIINYTNMFNKKNTGGFLIFPLSSLKKLIDMRKNENLTINHLKIYLHDLKACDNSINNPKFLNTKIVKKIYNVAKKFPKYLYNEKIRQIYNDLNQNNLLNIDYNGYDISISFNNETNGKYINKILEDTTDSYFKKIRKRITTKLKKLNITDLKFFKDSDKVKGLIKRKGINLIEPLIETLLLDDNLENIIKSDSTFAYYLNASLL